MDGLCLKSIYTIKNREEYWDTFNLNRWNYIEALKVCQLRAAEFRICDLLLQTAGCQSGTGKGCRCFLPQSATSFDSVCVYQFTWDVTAENLLSNFKCQFGHTRTVRGSLVSSLKSDDINLLSTYHILRFLRGGPVCLRCRRNSVHQNVYSKPLQVLRYLSIRRQHSSQS